MTYQDLSIYYNESDTPIAEVASSKINTFVRLTSARANAIICLCPTDKFVPPLETVVSNVILLSEFSGRWL
jgi:hypothetical protein